MKKKRSKQSEQKESPRMKEMKHKARRHSIREGIFASAKGSFGDRYLSPFAIAINASNSSVALLGSIGGLLGPLSQLFSSRLIEKYPRKKIVRKTVLGESLLWLPLIIIAMLFYKGIVVNILPLMFLLFFAIYVIIANIAGPAWFSWIGDLVDEEYRGRWFAKRNLILGFVSIVLALISSVFLDYFKGKGWVMAGFMIFFFLAFLFRLASWNFLKYQYEPKIKLKKGYYFSFWNFLINSPKNNFGKFTWYRAFLAFANTISASLLAIYLLRNLGFSYTIYTLITLAGGIFSLLVMDLWGKFADRYGNYRTILLTSFLIPLTPILWILSPNPLYLILIPTFVGGIAWAGFNLAAGNFIYDNISQEKRGLAVSYYNMMLGFGAFLGAGLSAILIKYLTIDFITPIAFIFILSAILRFIVVLIWIPKIKEVRKTKKFRGRTALKNLIFKDAKPTLEEEAHQIMSIKGYLEGK